MKLKTLMIIYKDVCVCARGFFFLIQKPVVYDSLFNVEGMLKIQNDSVLEGRLTLGFLNVI